VFLAVTERSSFIVYHCNTECCGLLTVSMDFDKLHIRRTGLAGCEQLPRSLKANWYCEPKERGRSSWEV